MVNCKRNWFSLSPLLVFLVLYLVTSIIVDDFYKVPITVAFAVSSIYAVCITRGLALTERIGQFSQGAANPSTMLMIWIFILAGAFAQSAKAMGAVDATVNLTLQLLPESMLLPGLFLAACFISLSIGTSVGTVVALTPMAVGVASQTGSNLPMIVAIVVGVDPVPLLCYRIPASEVEGVQMQNVRMSVACDEVQRPRHADGFFVEVNREHFLSDIVGFLMSF